MDKYYILIDGVAKHEYHSYSLACLRFEALKAKGFCGVSLMDSEFNVLMFC